MSSEYDKEIWNDPNKPKQEYLTMLVDLNDRSSDLGEPYEFEAPTDGEAWNVAYRRALDWCQKADKKALLILTGGSIHGTRSAEIDPL